MTLRNTLLLLQRIKPRTVVTVPTELWVTDTDRYTQAPSVQPDTLGHCSSLYVCGTQCTAGHNWPLFQSVCVWHPVYSRTHLATVPVRMCVAPSVQPVTLGHCSSLYVCGTQCIAGHTWPLLQSVCVWHPVYSRTHLATVPDATFWNLACYQAHSYESCHSDVDRTLWLINDLPGKELCHRITQENASFKYHQHEMSVYK